MSCPDCFTGSVHEGTPTGKEDIVHGLPTYIATPPDPSTPPKGIIVIIADAFGYKLPNTRLVADSYALTSKTLVYVPDFMNGASAPLESMYYSANIFGDAKTWGHWLLKPYYTARLVPMMIPIMRENLGPKAWSRVREFFESLAKDNEERERDGSKRLPVGVVGFCLGGLYTVRLAQQDPSKEGQKQLIDAAFTGHPSGLKIPSDLLTLQVPLSVAIGDRDFMVNAQGVQKMKTALGRRELESGIKTELVVYEGAGHGFTVRYDEGNKKVAEQAKQAERQALDWLEGRWKEAGFEI